MLRLALITALAGFSNCSRDETVAAYGGADQVWTLTEIDGADFGATATLAFPGAATISGQAPCNSYSGSMDAPYPWFEARDLAVTRRACPDLALETRFFEALQAMTLAEVSGGTLILSNDKGREMVFRAGV